MKTIIMILIMLMAVNGCDSNGASAETSVVSSTPVETVVATPQPTIGSSMVEQDQFDDAITLDYLQYAIDGIDGSQLTYWVLDPLPQGTWVSSLINDEGVIQLSIEYTVDEQFEWHDITIGNTYRLYPLSVYQNYVDNDPNFFLYGNHLLGRVNDYMLVESFQMAAPSIPLGFNDDGSLIYDDGSFYGQLTQFPLLLFDYTKVEEAS